MLHEEKGEASAFDLDLAEVELRCLILDSQDIAIPTDYHARLSEAGFILNDNILEGDITHG